MRISRELDSHILPVPVADSEIFSLTMMGLISPCMMNAAAPGGSGSFHVTPRNSTCPAVPLGGPDVGSPRNRTGVFSNNFMVLYFLHQNAPCMPEIQRISTTGNPAL